jgi:hypothetical protein
MEIYHHTQLHDSTSPVPPPGSSVCYVSGTNDSEMKTGHSIQASQLTISNHNTQSQHGQKDTNSLLNLLF